MEKKYNWKVGEVVRLPESTSVIKQGSMDVYDHIIRSNYVCVREATESQPGILVKVLGKFPAYNIDIVEGEPFCKDVRDKLFEGNHYSSFRFPLAKDLIEALALIRSNQELINIFNKEGMHVNPNSTFWVRETTRQMLLLKKPQYYDASSGSISIAQNDNPHYRLSIVYYQGSMGSGTGQGADNNYFKILRH